MYRKPSALIAIVLWSGGCFAADSWMNEQQRRNSAQRELDAIQDQARRPNSPGSSGGASVDEDAALALCKLFGFSNCDPDAAATESQRYLQAAKAAKAEEEAKRRQAEREAIDRQAKAVGDRYLQWMQQESARGLAAAEAINAIPLNADTVNQHCAANKVYVTPTHNGGVPSVEWAWKFYSEAMKLNEGAIACQRGLKGVLEMIHDEERLQTKSYQLFDWPKPLTGAVMLSILTERVNIIESAGRKRAHALDMLLNPEKRTPPPANPPYPDWRSLRNDNSAEGYYWQSRVHALGLLGQERNLEAAKAAACHPKAQSYARNRINCWLQQNPDPDYATVLNFVQKEPILATVRYLEYADRTAAWDGAEGLARSQERGLLVLVAGEKMARIANQASQKGDAVTANRARFSACHYAEEALARGQYHPPALVYLDQCYVDKIITTNFPQLHKTLRLVVLAALAKRSDKPVS